MLFRVLRSWILDASLGRAVVGEVHLWGAPEVLVVYTQGDGLAAHGRSSSQV